MLLTLQYQDGSSRCVELPDEIIMLLAQQRADQEDAEERAKKRKLPIGVIAS